MLFWEKLPPILKNKYVLTLLLFFVWLLFFDQNNLLQRYKHLRHYNQLQEDKAYYHKRIENDASRLQQLESDKETLEKFAREEYYMKKPDEDIFIIVEEKD
ncbi:MAG: septum formation initiator family protein [Bacteroidetes bacterium]|jgi:cell division protein FtsB|nr:septum formation initiator family protein [Bacteroidota bacterium]